MNTISTPDDLPDLIDTPNVRVGQNADSDLSDNEQDYEEEDEDEEDRQEYRSLFSSKIFTSINDLFNHEAKTSGFDLVDVIDRYQMTLIDYIKMINFIRSKV